MLVNLAVNARDAMPAGGDLRITTRSEQGVRMRGGAAEGLPFLPKPFAPEDLAHTVRETLDSGRPVSLPPAR